MYMYMYIFLYAQLCSVYMKVSINLSLVEMTPPPPPQQGDYPWWTSCPSLGGVVQELMMSGVIGVTLPHLQDNLLPLFQLMDSTNARVSHAPPTYLQECHFSAV